MKEYRNIGTASRSSSSTKKKYLSIFFCSRPVYMYVFVRVYVNVRWEGEKRRSGHYLCRTGCGCF
jgi:hypothetical protein